MNRLVLKHFPQKKGNGDRSTTETLCYRYELVIRNDMGAEVLVGDADDYDNWHCTVDRTRSEYKTLRRRGMELSEFLRIDFEEVMMQEEVVTTTTWVEQAMPTR